MTFTFAITGTLYVDCDSVEDTDALVEKAFTEMTETIDGYGHFDILNVDNDSFINLDI